MAFMDPTSTARLMQHIHKADADNLDQMRKEALTPYLTAENYKYVMKEWFLANGCNVLADLRTLCDKWYEITRTGWSGGTQFYTPTGSTSSFGTKIGDNANLVCEPSTNATAGTDDYKGIPLFYPIDVHAELDSNGKVKITAIDGVCGSFDRTDATKITAVMQMTPYTKYVADTENNTYTWYYADHPVDEDYEPWCDAIELDSTIRNFVVHTKYVAGDGYTACAGKAPRAWDVSHNGQRTGIKSAWGDRYCGFTSADLAWLKMMFIIKYASKTGDSIMNGCLNYNYTYQPAVAETGVKRVILSTANAANLVVGSTVIVGTSNDRNNAAARSVVDRKRITKIENVTIDETTYAAVSLDLAENIDVTTSMYVITMPWYSGSCDNVQGNDGSPISNTSTKEPYKLQGIEYLVGLWIVAGDIILSMDSVSDVLYQRAHVVRDVTKNATSVTSDYLTPSYGFPKQSSANWYDIASNGHDENLPELLFPDAVGGSSSTLTRDKYYIPADAAGTTREALLFGNLNNGLDIGGVSTVFGNVDLSYAYWNIGACVSLTGNRGVLPAA